MNKEKISFQEIVDLVASRASVSKRATEDFLKVFFASIEEALMAGEVVKIKNLGTFKLQWNEPRKSVNIQTGEEILLSGYNKVSFTPDVILKDLVNEPFAHLKSVQLDDESNEAMQDDDQADVDLDPLRIFSEQATEIKSLISEIKALSPNKLKIDNDEESIISDTIIDEEELAEIEEVTVNEKNLEKARELEMAQELERIRDLELAKEKEIAKNEARSKELEMTQELERIKELELEKELELARNNEQAKELDLARELEHIKELELEKELELVRSIEQAKELEQAQELERIKELEHDKELELNLKLEKVKELELSIAFEQSKGNELTKEIERVKQLEQVKELERTKALELAKELEQVKELELAIRLEQAKEYELSKVLEKAKELALVKEQELANELERTKDLEIKRIMDKASDLNRIYEAPIAQPTVKVTPNVYKPVERVQSVVDNSVKPNVRNVKPKKKSKLWLWILVISILIVVGSGIGVYFLSFQGNVTTQNPETIIVLKDTTSIDSIGSEQPVDSLQILFDTPRVYPEFIASERLRRGTRLTQMAKRYYGTSDFWVYIYEANMKKLGNPDRIPSGTLIHIPKVDPRLIDGKNPRCINKARELHDLYVK